MLDLNYQPIPVRDTDPDVLSHEDWLKSRTEGIGGSDVPAIFEVSGWTTRRALYYAKKGLEKESPNPFTLNFGHAVEPFVAQAFQQSFDEKYKDWLEEKLGVKIASFLIYKDTWQYKHPLFPFMLADLDYRFKVTTDTGEEIRGVFECKTTSYHIGPEKWNGGKVPYDYELQTRHYMAVMNLPYTLIAVVWGNNEDDYRVRLVKRDYDLEEEIIEEEKAFWEDHVLANVPPELSLEHAEQEKEAMKSFSIAAKIRNGEIPELDADPEVVDEAIQSYLSVAEKIRALKDRIKDLEKEQTLAEVKILEFTAAMANEDGTFNCHLQSGGSDIYVENKKTSRTSVDTKKMKEEAPELWEKFKKVSESISLNVRKVSL